jgi:hypothetical protein
MTTNLQLFHSIVMARLDRATCTNEMALIGGPVEPGHDVRGESRYMSAAA